MLRAPGTTIPQEVALHILKVYLSGLDERIRYLEWLTRHYGRYEALLLCCCYIDGLGNVIYLSEDLGSHKGFVRVIREHGGDPYLPLIHPRHMLITLNRRVRRSSNTGVFASIRQAIDPLLQGTELVTEDDFLSSAQPYLDEHQHAKLRAFAWRGTMASFAYENIRGPAVHELKGPSGGTFANTTYRGQNAPSVSYDMLWPVLNHIYVSAQKLCADVVL